MMALQSLSRTHVRQIQPGFRQAQTHETQGAFNSLFSRLLRLRALTVVDELQRNEFIETTNIKIRRSISQTYSQMLDLERHKSYSRHIIGRSDYWTGLLCRWEAHAQSSIHGHPAFTYYYVVEGDFVMDFYRKCPNGAVSWDRSQRLHSGQYLFDYGRQGCYDNMIHRVTAIRPGFTLQLFSDEPSLGEKFTQ